MCCTLGGWVVASLNIEGSTQLPHPPPRKLHAPELISIGLPIPLCACTQARVAARASGCGASGDVAAQPEGQRGTAGAPGTS